MGMSGRLLRPRQTIHPETADWANRVRTNGGSVSGTTLSAVDRFVKAIHAAGIRDRFYRLNLFCGNSDASLNAVRTPLYSGPSLGGTQYGNATDTNANFVAGDYAENSGLAGNGTTKYLATGLPMTFLGTNATHHSVGFTPNIAQGYGVMLGARSNLAASVACENNGTSGLFRVANFSTGISAAYSPTAGRNRYFGSHTTGTFVDVYSRGALLATLTLGAYSAANTTEYFVFAGDTNGTKSLLSSARISDYSIGASMSPGQRAAYDAALVAFNTAMNRA